MPSVSRRLVAGAFLLAVYIAIVGAGSGRAQNLPGTVALGGNHPNEAVSLPPVAHADPAAPLSMEATLALRNGASLDQLLKDQQNPASPRYHQWLTSAEFAARFGPSQRDLDSVAQWLATQGFTVTSSSLTERYVRFSGTVADAEHAFGTNIMAFGDGTAYSNITDPAIPARFSGVIGRIGGLDNFLHSVAASQSPAMLQTTAVESTWTAPLALLDSGPAGSLPESDAVEQQPGVIVGGVGPAFGPSDFRSFYNENHLLSTGVSGAGGDCLAIVGTSDYTAGAVNLFNSTFSLPASSITTVLVDGTNPGHNGAQDEALLDLEWSHAVAPGAPSLFYLGNDFAASPNGSVVDAIARAVSDNACGVISVSFSLCGGSAAFFQTVVSPIYAQAAAHGQSIFISSGDWGAAGLIFNGTACVVASSRNVNELASDLNVTQVGGTQFNPIFNGSGNNLGQVAESVWNDSASGGDATGGGVSAVYGKPSYQKGPGVPNDAKRDVPDVALIASPNNPGSFWGSTSAGSPAIKCCIGGTSLSAPAWAGIAKLIAQLNHNRPGPLNPRIYALANAGQAASGFRDVLSGNNDFNGVAGFSAGPGFDLDTGWGTVDIGTFSNDYVSPPSPAISSVPSPIRVGSSFTITGSFFSPGAMVNFFVATASGPKNFGPLTPSFVSSTQLIVPVPVTVPLGEGFVTVVVINADLGFKASNQFSTLLQGSAGAGIPTLTSINHLPLAATASTPNNVSTVIIQGTSVPIGGSGFDTVHGVAVNVFCNCPPSGNAGPVDVNPGSGGLTSTSFNFTLPPGMPTGPASLAVVNKGNFKSSNAVSIPVGAKITVTLVKQSGSIITVNGTGFSAFTVINFFNQQGTKTPNLGGIVGGVAVIRLHIINANQFTFTRPAGAVSGPSYVQAINPPFVPFSISAGPGGNINLL